MYPLHVRLGGEWHNPDEFIRPNDGMVKEAVARIISGAKSDDEAICRLWDYVCHDIRYPLTLTGESTDYHLLKAFPVSGGLLGTRFLITCATEEFFQFPSETLDYRVGDCDCTAILLGRMLGNILPAEKVSVMVGSSRASEKEADHAWVEADLEEQWVIMETALASIPSDVVVRARRIATAGNGNSHYLPFLEFNDVDREQRLLLLLVT